MKFYNNNVTKVPYDHSLVSLVLQSHNNCKTKLFESNEIERIENSRKIQNENEERAHQTAIIAARETKKSNVDLEEKLQKTKKEISAKTTAMSELKKTLYEKIEKISRGSSTASYLETVGGLKSSIENLEKEILEKQK
jgi:excinuclease UvrABC helicase subunit UvrB